MARNFALLRARVRATARNHTISEPHQNFCHHQLIRTRNSQSVWWRSNGMIKTKANFPSDFPVVELWCRCHTCSGRNYSIRYFCNHPLPYLLSSVIDIANVSIVCDRVTSFLAAWEPFSDAYPLNLIWKSLPADGDWIIGAKKEGRPNEGWKHGELSTYISVYVISIRTPKYKNPKVNIYSNLNRALCTC